MHLCTSVLVYVLHPLYFVLQVDGDRDGCGWYRHYIVQGSLEQVGRQYYACEERTQCDGNYEKGQLESQISNIRSVL
jgi:hypothetical protein